MSPRALAIVGMACELPGASDLASFWGAAGSGRDPFVPLPPERFDAEALALELPPGAPSPARGALLDDSAASWRALRLPPVQIERMHRMERAALLTMCRALDDAGVRRNGGPFERAQIWVAATTLGSDRRVDHMRRIRRFELAAPIDEALAAVTPALARPVSEAVERLLEGEAPPIHPDSFTTSASLIAGRVANLYDFQGGHAAVDAGEASSLAALARAAEALEAGDCDLALVCGISPILAPAAVLTLARRGWLSARAARPFAPDADGTLPGEGCAAVVLRRSEEARGQRIYALVEGLASASAPRRDTPDGLAECVHSAATRALAQAGTAPGEVPVVESRACGIAALDEAEARGLSRAYRGAPGDSLRVTSSVPVTGFLQGASGMVALVKAALALWHGTWPAQGGAGLGTTVDRLEVARATIELPRRAGVSDAGPGALAWHAVLAAPDPALSAREPRPGSAAVPVAIVGAGILVPGAGDPEAFWRNTLGRVDAIGDLPPSRWDVDRLVGSRADLAQALKTRLAGTVDLPPVDRARFGLPEGALDPAVAMALVVSEQALRDAGHRPGLWQPDRVGVVFGQLPLRATEASLEVRVLFAEHLGLAARAMRARGLGGAQVEQVLAAARRRFDRDCPPLPGGAPAASGLECASRVAAAFGFDGETCSIDAACASSLAALQVAGRALSRGDADVVVAGGIAWNLLPEYYVTLGLLGALSPRGVWPFHRGANGFVPAEGAGAVVLKRLEDARAAGDRIYAVLRGHGSSSDGRGLSIFAPSSRGQQLAIRRALAAAGAAPAEIDYLEAHGTATELGDRTEMESILAVFGDRPATAPLAIGAVKSQVGHCSSAGGIVGVIKTALALRERLVPPSNGDGDLATALPFGRAPLELALSPRPWPSPRGRPRRAGVSAFGLGGVNHHLVVEEAPERPEARPRAPSPAPPARGLRADRFVAELTPVALPPRAPTFRLRGKRLLLLGADSGAARRVEAALAERGAEVVRLDPAALPSYPEAQRQAAALHGARALAGVIDMTTFGPGQGLAEAAPAELGAEIARLAQRTFGVAAALYASWEAGPDRTGCHVAVTALGGEMGLTGRPAGNPLGWFFLGFAQALKQELPGLVCKVVDFDPLEREEALAEFLLREVEDGNDRVAVGFAGRRFVANLRRSPPPAGAPVPRPVREGDVFLFSGGGRGVVFECACALARAGARVVVTGRSPAADPALPFLALDDRAFAAFRAGELARRRAEAGFTPARFVREFEALARAREVHRNLQHARREGLALEYEVCDVTEPASVAALAARVRDRHGRIDGLGHGAMVEASASLPRKSPDAVARTIETKVLGIANLLDATRDDPLRVVIAFGSGASRFGNRGQADYAAANALMAGLLQARAGLRSRPVHCVTVDWPAWESVGAAADPDMAALLRDAGATSIALDEGVYWFLSELTLGGEQHVAILEERMLQSWPFLGASAEGRGARAVELDDRGAPLVPARWPMADHVVERAPRRLVVQRRLELRRDLYLEQHRLRGEPILPATFALEAMAEAACLASPGLQLLEASDVRMETPLALERGEAVDVLVEAGIIEEAAARRIVETRMHTAWRVREREVRRVHHRSRFVLGPASLGPPEQADAGEVAGPVRARSFVHNGRAPLGRGPLFSLAAWLQILDEGALGTALPYRAGDLFAHVSSPRFQIDPVLLDTALQVAGSWDGYRHGYVPVPLGFSRLVPGRPLRPRERARVRAHVARVAHPDVFVDLLVVGEDGQVLLRATGVHLRRIAGGDRPVELVA